MARLVVVHDAAEKEFASFLPTNWLNRVWSAPEWASARRPARGIRATYQQHESQMTMTRTLYPVFCPRCDEAQNTLPGKFDPDREPFGPVGCMVCGHEFSREEYLAGLANETARRSGGNVIPIRRN